VQHAVKGHVAFIVHYGNSYTASAGKQKKGDHMKNLVIDGRTLKWVLE